MSKKVSHKKQYSQEFREQVLEYLDNTPKGMVEVAKEFGVPYPNLVRWRKVRDERKSTPQSNDENKKLKLEIERLKKENEILKKAATFFAKHLD